MIVPGFKKSIGLIVLVLAFVSFNATTSAYVLQGPHILELMAEGLGRAKSLLVHQKVIFYNISPSSPSTSVETQPEKTAGKDFTAAQAESRMKGEGTDLPAEMVELDETLRYDFPHAFRADIASADNQRIHVFADGEAVTVIDGAVKSGPEISFDYYKDLLLIRSRPELVDRLKQLHVDVSLSSLGRFEGQTAFVIGARYPDESVSQVWVDQKTFRPIRWIISNGEGYHPLDVRYLSWWQLGDIWYPMRIEFFQDGNLVRAIQVQKYGVNPEFSKSLFDIEQLKSSYPKAPAALSASSESEGMSEVQKTIEEFKKIFE
jgi:outer membrane lipoprotein-sorting protein